MPATVPTSAEFDSLAASVSAISTRVKTIEDKLAVSPTPTPTPTTSGTRLYVPLFTYPTSSTWTTVANLQTKYPNQKFIVTVNPNSGVGSSSNPDFVTGINKLKAPGSLILGYIFTSYGSRPIADVKAEVDKYKLWYGVGGIFLDEMKNVTGSEQYYKDINAYVKSVGMTYVMGNPGTSTTTAYADTVDNVLVYESAGAPSLATVQQRTNNGSPSPAKYGIIPYGVPTLDPNYVKSIKPYLGTLYITNDSGSNPWDTIPPYLEQLIIALQ